MKERGKLGGGEGREEGRCVYRQTIVLYHKLHKFNFVISKIEKVKVKGHGSYVLNIVCVERIKYTIYDQF